MNVVLSRNFASAFGLTLICSLLGSYLAGFPYLEVIGALVISLILGMLAQRYLTQDCTLCGDNNRSASLHVPRLRQSSRTAPHPVT